MNWFTVSDSFTFFARQKKQPIKAMVRVLISCVGTLAIQISLWLHLVIRPSEYGMLEVIKGLHTYIYIFYIHILFYFVSYTCIFVGGGRGGGVGVVQFPTVWCDNSWLSGWGSRGSLHCVFLSMKHQYTFTMPLSNQVWQIYCWWGRGGGGWGQVWFGQGTI